MPTRIVLSVLILLGSMSALPLAARADIVHLKRGGQVRGEIDAASKADDAPQVLIRTLSGTELIIAREEIESVEYRSLIIEEYETRARAIPDTVDAHWELAEWARDQRLQPQREDQLELLLDLEPEHADARRILGHVKHNGQWMTRDEWMTSRGYVRHEGKWITLQERDLLLKTDAEREAERAWFPKIRQWSTWVTGRNSQRASDGLAELRAINDPDAVPALLNFMGDEEDDDVRMLCVELLGQLNGDKPVEPLVDMALRDGDEDVRLAARRGVKAEQYELALHHYVPELKNDSNTIVQRAAAAIADIGNPQVVPYLIEALVTTHKWKIEVPANNTTSFGVSPNGQISMSGVQSGMLPAEVELLARSGQLPYGAVVNPPRFAPRQTRMVTIKGDVKNAAVRTALKKITGQDFGYDERQWQVWYQTEGQS